MMSCHYVIWVLALFATDAADTEPPRFYIETIEVISRGPVSQPLVETESRLETGKTYNESQLRDAVDRIRRLPFVLEALFSLEKGSRKGRYRLVIKVRASSLFLTELSWLSDLDEDGNSTSDGQILLGVRKFLGKHGLIYGAYLPDTDSHLARDKYNLGYTNYALFGSRLFLNLDLHLEEGAKETESGTETSIEPVFTPTLNLGYFLGGHQWIKSTLAYNYNRTNTEFEQADLPDNYTSFRTHFLSTSWQFNSTDDSWMPTTGTDLQAILSLEEVRWHRRGLGSGDGLFNGEIFIQATNIMAKLKRYFSPNPRQTWIWGVEACRYEDNQTFSLRDDSSVTFRVTELTLQGGYQHQLLPPLMRYRMGDCFLSLSEKVHYTDFRFLAHPGLMVEDKTGWTYRSELSVAYRGKWGILRATFSYAASE